MEVKRTGKEKEEQRMNHADGRSERDPGAGSGQLAGSGETRG